MDSSADFLHDGRQAAASFTTCALGLGNCKFAEEIKLELDFTVLGDGHDNQISLAIFRYEDGFIRFVGEFRDFISFIPQIGNWSYDRHLPPQVVIINIISFK